jgi:molecular chaperone GrpE
VHTQVQFNYPTAIAYASVTYMQHTDGHTKDKYLRSVADFRNLQDRTKREISAAKDFALQRFARDLVESVDNLDRALSNVPSASLTDANPDLVMLHDGLKMTETILMQTLKKHGLERIDPSIEGEKFNPNLHEAVFQTPMPDKEDGTVFHTQSKGFMLNGRVLRVCTPTSRLHL